LCKSVALCMGKNYFVRLFPQTCIRICHSVRTGGVGVKGEGGESSRWA
jgi:hypothetical protein